MYMLLKKDCYLKRTDLEREYEKHGYEKKFENYFISQKILNSLRDTFYDKLAVDKTGKVEVKRNDDEFPIKDNEKFKKFQSKYGVEIRSDRIYCYKNNMGCRCKKNYKKEWV